MKTTKRTSTDAWLDSLAHRTEQARDGAHLRAIGEALTELEAAQARLDQAVHNAHDAGDSWAAIGVVLGTTRQAAHKRFGRPDRGR
ncbi:MULTISPECIES: hypothetical protein [unclassified Plantibacter]|uniref:hypothetical protein n=1 Tax=unclassified Plantibacter TaxID=2624265 RepID=UPI003D341F08